MTKKNIITICLLAVFVVIIILCCIVVADKNVSNLEGFYNSMSNNERKVSNRDYTSYSDMVLQETLDNRRKYLKELKERDVSESYPWINIDGVWEQGTLFPTSLINPNKGNKVWNRERRWVPRQRQYQDFSDVLYIGNPLPQ